MSTAAIISDINSIMDYENNYSIKTEGNALIFRTSTFKAEKSSVLHSGVYSKEFMSILMASGVCMLAYMFLSPSISGPALFTTLMFILVAAFTGARTFIFKEKYLETVFNRSSSTARLTYSGTFSKKTEEIPFAEIISVETDIKRFEQENKDGADFVQKISVQHGSAVPGLGETEEFMTLSLKLKDGSERMIYAGDLKERPVVPAQEIKEFIFNQN